MQYHIVIVTYLLTYFLRNVGTGSRVHDLTANCITVRRQNMKPPMSYRLTPRPLTLDDLEQS